MLCGHRILSLSLGAVLSLTSIAIAQVTSARLNGTVVDVSGATIAHAHTTATNTATNQTHQAVADDSWELPASFSAAGSLLDYHDCKWI